jgi:hypothetical protein
MTKTVKPKPTCKKCKKCKKPLYKTSKDYWTCWGGNCRGLIPNSRVALFQGHLYRTKDGKLIMNLEVAKDKRIDPKDLTRVKEFEI